MGAREFGRLVDRAIHEHGMSQARLAVLVGELPDGKVLNETQVRRIREGELIREDRLRYHLELSHDSPTAAALLDFAALRWIHHLSHGGCGCAA